MADPTNDPDPETETIDPQGFGPETVDGRGPAASETSPPAKDSEPGDPDLNAKASEEPAD